MGETRPPCPNGGDVEDGVSPVSHFLKRLHIPSKFLKTHVFIRSVLGGDGVAATHKAFPVSGDSSKIRSRYLGGPSAMDASEITTEDKTVAWI